MKSTAGLVYDRPVLGLNHKCGEGICRNMGRNQESHTHIVPMCHGTLRAEYDRYYMTDLGAQFGDIDIYLFDQLLRHRITAGMRILDAGCGFGRNLVYLLKEGFEVYGADLDPRALNTVRHLAASLSPSLPADNFRLEPVEAMSFPDGFADVAISSAVLHFATEEVHFRAMLGGTWRILKPGGLLFCRLASSIGMEGQVQRIAGRRFRLPDGSDRYLVDEAHLLTLTEELRGQLEDPLKTTVVQNQRSMTTWVVRKSC